MSFGEMRHFSGCVLRIIIDLRRKIVAVHITTACEPQDCMIMLLVKKQRVRVYLLKHL